MLTIALCGATNAATPTVGIALTKRSGVSAKVALERVQLVRTTLSTAAPFAAPADFTRCAARLPCVLKAAQEQGWTTLVTVEIASVLSESIVNVSLRSVDDDGKELAKAIIQAPEGSLPAALERELVGVRKQLADFVSPPSPATPPLAVTPTTPAPVEPAPPPTVAPVAPSTVTTSAERPAARWIPLGVSLGVLAAGGIFLGISNGTADRLRSDVTLVEPDITRLAADGKAQQLAGASLLIGGGVLAAGSLALGLLWPEAKVTPSLAVGPERAGIVFSGALP